MMPDYSLRAEGAAEHLANALQLLVDPTPDLAAVKRRIEQALDKLTYVHPVDCQHPKCQIPF